MLVMQETSSDKWDIPWYTTHGITILYHAIENTVANTINATYLKYMTGRLDVIWLNTQWLSCIPIGCIFYAMV